MEGNEWLRFMLFFFLPSIHSSALSFRHTHHGAEPLPGPELSLDVFPLSVLPTKKAVCPEACPEQ